MCEDEPDWVEGGMEYLEKIAEAVSQEPVERSPICWRGRMIYPGDPVPQDLRDLLQEHIDGRSGTKDIRQVRESHTQDARAHLWSNGSDRRSLGND